MDLKNKDFVAVLEKYRKAAEDAATLRRQVETDQRKMRKLLAIEAMDLVANNKVNPLTNKAHTWTSAQDYVRDSERGDELKTNFLELQYTAELAQAEANICYAELLWFVNPNGH
jgi:hypothetical protein